MAVTQLNRLSKRSTLKKREYIFFFTTYPYTLLQTRTVIHTHDKLFARGVVRADLHHLKHGTSSRNQQLRVNTLM